MGYLHIQNLSKNNDILAFKRIYALEKIHGTSAHISWHPQDGVVDSRLGFFSGGEKYDNFIKLFDHAELLSKFNEKFGLSYDVPPVIIFGEAYGGKQQGMSSTYGKELKFVAFDVKIGETWLNVPIANAVCKDLGIEFVHFVEIPALIDDINQWRDAPSTQAVRNGAEGDKIREGVVLRSPFECRTNNGERVIAKHKRSEFSERKSKKDVDLSQREVLIKAEEIAEEWVTAVRLQHVVDRYTSEFGEYAVSVEDTGEIIKAMIEDVMREGAGELVDDKLVRKEIASKTARMFKKSLEVV